MPWKIGHSAGIRERNLVEVRGFPARCLSSHQHREGRSRPTITTTIGDWDHDDFIVDALLSRGNSGSPVLGISCATGEYELVGVYHAGYSEGTALNVVIGIDQVRDLMATLKRAPRRREEAAVTVDAAARRAVVAALADGGDTFFPFGSQVALARQAGSDAILLALFSKEFPSLGEPALVLEDTAGLRFDQLRIPGPHLARLDARAQGVRSVGARCRRPGADQARARGAPRRSGRRARLPGRRGRRRVAIVGRCRAPAGEGAGPGRRVSRRSAHGDRRPRR